MNNDPLQSFILGQLKDEALTENELFHRAQSVEPKTDRGIISIALSQLEKSEAILRDYDDTFQLNEKAST